MPRCLDCFITRPVSVLCCVAALLTPVHAGGASDADIEALRQEVSALRARVQRLEGEIASGVAVNPARKVQPVAGGWRASQNWKLLAKGMQESRVVEILGEPDDTRRIGKFEVWTFGTGQAKFYLGRLKSWRQP